MLRHEPKALSKVAFALSLVGCSFHPRGFLASPVDRGVDADPNVFDAAPVPVDLTAARADLPPADLVSDPCGSPPPPAPGVVGVRCVIDAPPVIDGNLDEWAADTWLPLSHETFAIALGTWTGTPATDDADSSGFFALRWDRTNLYVAARVVDDVRGVHPLSTMNFLDDAVGFYVDGSGDRSVVYGPDDHQLIITSDKRAQEYKGGVLQAMLPAGILFEVARGSGANWTLEIALPWTQLGGAPVPGRVLGIDFELDDDDDPMNQVRKHFLVWSNHATSVPTCTQPFCSTEAFGVAQLTGR